MLVQALPWFRHAPTGTVLWQCLGSKADQELSPAGISDVVVAVGVEHQLVCASLACFVSEYTGNL